MLNDIFGQITDAACGRAFEAFTTDYLRRPPAERPAYEALIESQLGASYLEDWRGWRQRRGYP
jgi:hypothetical protein